MNKKYIYMCFLMCCALAACKDDVGTTLLDGTLSGKVVLYDALSQELDSCDDVVVTAVNGKQEWSSLTNQRGRYQIDELETGTYTLQYQKEGYGIYKLYGYPFVGGEEASEVYDDVELVQEPAYYFKNLKVEMEEKGGETYFNLNADVFHLPENETYVGMRYFISNQEDVSVKNYEVSEYANISVNNDQVFRAVLIDPELLETYHSLYVVVYPCAMCAHSYTEPEYGKKVYYTTGSQYSNVVEVTNF